MALEKDHIIKASLILLAASIIGLISTMNILAPIILVSLFFATILFVLFMKKRLTYFHYMLAFVPLICLSPIIPTGGPDVKLDDLWLIFGAFLLLAKLSMERFGLKWRNPNYAKVFLFFIAWIAVTVFISSFRTPYLYAHRDWFEVIKNLKFLAIFIMAINLKITAKQYQSFFNWFVISLLIASIFGFAQYFNLFSINSWLTPYFVFETQVYNLEVHNRIVGTFGNSNVFAGILMLGVAVSLAKFLDNYKIRNLLFIGIFLVAITLTLSRTVLVCTVLVIGLVFFQLLLRSQRKMLMSFLMILFSIIPAIVVLLAPSSFFERAGRLSDLSEDTSFQARLEVWRVVYNEFARDNLITGTGPISEIHFYYDNEWLSLLSHYGIIGVSVFVLFIGLLIYKMGKLNHEVCSNYNIALRSTLAIYGLYMVTLIVFQQLQMMPLIMLLSGVVMSVYYNSEKAENKKTRKKYKIVWSKAS